MRGWWNNGAFVLPFGCGSGSGECVCGCQAYERHVDNGDMGQVADVCDRWCNMGGCVEICRC